MKRIKFLLLALTMLSAAPALLTSCQEDAPEINYTMNVTVNNDFSTVVDAINNGTLKSTEAIMKLVDAIDKMNADQQAKLQAVIDVLNSVSTTLDTKLAAIEAAIKAQTLSLESKLALIEAATQKSVADSSAGQELIQKAIEALTGTLEEKLAAIEAAIASQTTGLGAKLDLIEAALKAGFTDQKTALGEVKTALEALKGSVDGIDTAIDDIVDAIDRVTAAIDDTNDALNGAVADALADIFSAIDGLTDYSEILAAIKTAIENIETGGGEHYANFLVIDGETTSFSGGEIDKSDLFDDGNYDINLFPEGRSKSTNFINIMAVKKYHDANTVDLTEKEPKRAVYEWYWAVTCYNHGIKLFGAFADPETPDVVFKEGSLYITRLADNALGKPVFEIKLENGVIVDDNDGDGREHTISLHYIGPLDLEEL